MTPTSFVLTEEQKKKIIHALEQRGAVRPCGRCGTDNFSLTEALTTILLSDGRNLTLGGPAIPTAIIICTHCGAVYQHALGSLGLFEDFGFKTL